MFAGSVSLGALTSQFSGLSLSRAPRATTVAAPMARASVTVHGERRLSSTLFLVMLATRSASLSAARGAKTRPPVPV